MDRNVSSFTVCFQPPLLGGDLGAVDGGRL